jgi:hypothetical protein
MRAGALPGRAPVVLDPELMLAVDVVPGEDGHARVPRTHLTVDASDGPSLPKNLIRRYYQLTGHASIRVTRSIIRYNESLGMEGRHRSGHSASGDRLS